MLTTQGKIHKIAGQNNGKEVSGMTSFLVLVVRRSFCLFATKPSPNIFQSRFMYFKEEL